MTKVERPVDYNEAVNDFLRLHQQELELQAIKLSRLYRIDIDELVSRTTETIWKKWPILCTLPQDKDYKYALRILSNHARNLSRNARHDESKCETLPGEELECLTHTTITWRDPVAMEAIFEDERFAIYKAISLLDDGRCKDVMALIALGRENSEIRQELGLTETNLTSILWRARKSLREILGLGDSREGDEPR